jgi:AcrR family transcriptional regulator
MITTANRDGYVGANVSAVIAEAGVSRPTFYEYFADRDDCFLAAHAEAHERLLGAIRVAVDQERPERALHASLRALVEFAVAKPALARFLMNEPMAGGAMVLDARDQGIAAIEQIIEVAYGHVDGPSEIPDFSVRMVVGGTYRMLASRLRRGEPNMSGLAQDLLSWIGSYSTPAARSRWRGLDAGPVPPPSPFAPDSVLRAPDPLPPGRPRISEERVAENQRQRIMFAAAKLAAEQGYAASTVAEITRRAGVDGRVFYSMFADKHHAFMAVHELGFQHVMDVTAGAFFAGATWPERNWEAARAFTQFLERNPVIAHVGFVEAYAVGPGAAQRLEDSQSAFAMLLQEGYQYVPQHSRPSRVVLEAIIATIFETVYHRARASGSPRLSVLLGHLTFLVLSPFMGPAQANAFIEEKLAQ